MRLVKVVNERPGAVLVPPASLKLDLDAPLERPKTLAPGGRSSGGRGTAARGATTAGWWTARATAGEVTPGFSKEEILRKPEEDPRAEGGIFPRVGSLLLALGEPR
jgi:hypothetical protein